MWDGSGNSANGIHERLQPVTSYLSMNGVNVVDSNGCQELHVYMHVSEILDQSLPDTPLPFSPVSCGSDN